MKKYLPKPVLCIVIVVLLSATVSTVAFAQSSDFATTAKAAIVVEQSSGRVLFEKNAHQSLPMASTTKIVTALTVLNNCFDLEQLVEVPAEACGVEGSSVYLRVGEHLTLRELLLGLMLRSGNDCAVALAIATGGSVENFAEMMNKTAADLHCNESHFVTPHGLHDDGHYTSASDLARLTCAALNNADFRQIVTTKRAEISNEGMGSNRILLNKNKLLASYDGADGVKTGYTQKAGRCFVGSATRNGMQLVAVVLNCGPMFEETASLFDVAFGRYFLRNVIPQNKLCGVIYRKGQPTYYSCPQPFSYPVKVGENLSTKIILTDSEQKISVFLEGQEVFSRLLEPSY